MMQKLERNEMPPGLDDKRFGWQVSEGIANLRLECLKLALNHQSGPFKSVNPLMSNVPDPIELAKRMADFVIDGTVTTKDTP